MTRSYHFSLIRITVVKEKRKPSEVLATVSGSVMSDSLQLHGL